MTKGPPESPPAADWGPSLIEHYPPHGFPPYLGLGLLDAATLRLEPGRSVAEYRAGSDLVYRVTGSFDPAEGDVACAAKASEWSIEEFFDGRSWRTTDGYESLPQAFYHHIGGQLPTENPRLAALIERLVCDFNVAVRIRAQTSYVMFPAGYVYAVRVPLTPDTVENFKAFAAAEPGPVSVPLPSCAKPRSVAILKLSTTYWVSVERGTVVDVTVPLYRLVETIQRLRDTGADAGPIHLRPEVIYAHERARKHCQIHPGKIAREIVTYTVLPIDDDAPPLEDLKDTFSDDSFEIFNLVREALYSDPPEDDPFPDFYGKDKGDAADQDEPLSGSASQEAS
jgi:hypothetical protein